MRGLNEDELASTMHLETNEGAVNAPTEVPGSMNGKRSVQGKVAFFKKIGFARKRT
jgi:hypothetical protein